MLWKPGVRLSASAAECTGQSKARAVNPEIARGYVFATCLTLDAVMIWTALSVSHE
jgi:hypothetical protein